MSCSNCCFLTCIQISEEAGQMAWYSHLFKNFPEFVVVHTVKGLNTSWKIDEETMETVTEFIFLNSKISAVGDGSHKIKRCLLLGRKAVTNLESSWKSRDITLPTKVRVVQAIVLPLVMYGCESWSIKMAEHQRIDAFELWCWWRFLSVCWTGSEIKPVSPTGNHHWIVTVRNDTESEAPILWPPYGESWLIRMHLNAGKVWKKEEGMTEYETVGWHHTLNGLELEQAPGDGEGQRSLVFCSPWDHKKWTRLLNNKLLFVLLDVFLVSAAFHF